MARLTILTPKELQAIYGIPQFTDDERGLYFSLDPLEKQSMDEIRTYTAKVFFILQLGYFKANKQFFVFNLKTVADDAAYILRRYFPKVPELSDLTISKPTRLAQQTEILHLFDYHTCSPEWKKKLQEKANQLVTIYTKPVYVFRELLNFLEYRRIMLPGYSFMREKVIGKALSEERRRLEKAVKEGIPKASLIASLRPKRACISSPFSSMNQGTSATRRFIKRLKNRYFLKIFISWQSASCQAFIFPMKTSNIMPHSLPITRSVKSKGCAVK